MGVIYYKLKSKYEGDATVDRSLRCDEVDGNFYFLRGYDISEVGVNDETGELILKRVNGDKLTVPMNEAMAGVSMSFDDQTGTLRIGDNVVTGFTKDIFVKVSVNDTLRGNGDRSNPLRISETEKTGTFAAVDEFRDFTETDGTLTNDLAESERLPKGYRIVTKENISKLGLLYNYENAKSIQNALDSVASQWRIPSKNDWDKMLNSIEPRVPGHCGDSDVTTDHSSKSSNEWLGTVAGRKLKTVNVWNNSVEDAAGTDSYGFSVLPVGYIEDSGAVVNIRKYAAFWTSDVEDAREDMFIKRFDDNSPKVYQSTWDPQKKLSIRLVKDYDGSNFYESEYIEGINLTMPCVLMSSSKTIWTKVNVSAKQFDGVTSEFWDNFTEEEKESFNAKVYLLNEWDGEKWIKRQLFDGQSMVFRNYNDPEKGELHYHEYVVIKVDDKYELRDNVSLLEEQFEEELEAIREDISELNDNLSAETEARISAETEIQQDIVDIIDAISAETTERISRDEELTASAETLSQGLSDEIDRAVSAETKLENEIQELVSADTAIRHDLDEEIQRAQSVETEIKGDLSAETTNRVERDYELTISAETLFNGLYEEVQARSTRDEELTVSAETLYQNLSNEIQRAESAELEIKNSLTAETQARISRDNELTASADTLNQELSALTDSLNSEIERSTQKDVELTNAILDEQARAEVAEESLHDEISTVKESAGLDGEGNYVPNANANYIDQATSLADADNKLDEALKLEEIERKGIHVVKVTDLLPLNIKEAYDLVDKDGLRIENSERILIYKDNSLVNVYLGTTGDELVDYDHPDIIPGSGDTAICFVYQMSNGQYRLIKVDVEEFLQETEFEDGLSVNHGVVKVKIDELSDDYLTVSQNGVRLSGVKTAITSLTTTLNNEISRAQSADTALQTALNTETATREIAVQSLGHSISAETAARENADSILTNAVNVLNGPYNQNGSVKKSVIDAVVGTIVTSITPEQAKDQSLARIIEGTGKFYVSNNSMDIKYGDTNVSAALDSANTRIESIEEIVATAYTKVDELEQELDAAKLRIDELETALAAANQRIDNLENNLETIMRDFMLGFIKGYDNEIAIVRCDSSGNPTQITDETKFIKIKFAPDAIFMAD